MSRAAALLLALALAACGAYPQPFAGNPGRTAARLAVPPPPRLAVVPPVGSLLADADAARFASALADALVAREVPAVVGAGTAEWRLSISAKLVPGAGVVPTYTVLNPKSVAQGSATGAAVAASSWSQGNLSIINLVASRDAPAIATLLESISAAVQQSDPNSLVNRPPRIVLAGVSGAPGDGNRVLSRLIHQDLSGLGIVVQTSPQGADYKVAGTIRVSPAPAGQSRIEIQWTVTDIYGHEAGHLLQMNDVPEGSLDRYWGDVAMVVAEEAAGGVRDVIINQTAVHRIGTKPKT